MGTKVSFGKMGLMFFALFFAVPALAEVPPLEKLNYKLKYEVTWNGLHIGRIRIKVREDAFSYSLSIDTKTGGIARLFSDEQSVASAEGRIVNGKYMPTRYSSRNDNSSRQRTTITYDANGNIATQERKPPRGKSRTEVPLEDANRATDPTTAFFILRQQLHGAMKQNARDVSARTYDGVRLAEFLLHVVGPARAEVVDHYESAINTVISRKPLNGYSPKELKKFKEGDPVVYIFFTADSRFIPVKATVQTGFGAIAVAISEIKEGN